MTTICPGSGPSQPKAWVPSLFLIPAGAGANYIGNAGGIWASIIAAAIGVKTYAASTACTTDPPGWPSAVTAAEAIAVATNQIGTPEWTSALLKANQMLDNVLWYLLCECVTGPQPAQPTFPAPPSGLPTTGPLPTAPSSRQCVTVVTPVLGAADRIETSQGGLDLSRQLLPYTGAQSNPVDVAGFNQLAYVAPSPTPQLVRIVLDGTAGVLQQVDLFALQGANWSVVAGLLPFTNPGAGVTHVDTGLISLPATTQWAVVTGQQHAYPVAQPMTICLETYGPSNPGGVTCCPPDPLTMSLLQQIIGTLTPLQRYRQPFAFITGASHSGLTGTGTIALPRCVGVDLVVTASPAGKPVSSGNPQYVFDLGWVSVSEVGGMLQERRVSQLHFTWLPEHMALADHFNYFLQPGVTITMTELYAEP